MAADVAPFPALALPFKAGQQVYSAGIHSDDGSTGVENAIDFSPADPVDGKTLGGWRFTAGAEQYTGTATHVSDDAVTQLPGRFRAKL